MPHQVTAEHRQAQDGDDRQQRLRELERRTSD
jgi:hypothetical protein